MRTSSESGQTAAEYSVMLGVITVGIVLAFAALDGVIVRLFEAAVGVFA
jgi:Flp pilus assembly pilin Flp